MTSSIDLIIFKGKEFKELKRRSFIEEYKFTELFIETMGRGNSVTSSDNKLYVYTKWQWEKLMTKYPISINLDMIIFSLGPPDDIEEKSPTSSKDCCVLL